VRVSISAVVLAVAGAPLAVGGVHRPALLILGSLALVAVGFLGASEWRAGGRLRFSKATIFPAAFVFLTAFQLIPLPPWMVDRIDPNGATLLADGGGGSGGWRFLSLDPGSTGQALARATTAFLIFLAAYHFAAKRNSRSWILRSVVMAGMAAVTIGLGHRIFAIPKIYGLFENGRISALLTGPFINANHCAEFLELATFVGLACARQAITPLGRIGWHSAAAVAAAGALATLSRSSVFALGAGVAVIVAGQATERQSAPGTFVRRRWLPLMAWLAAIGLVAVSIGAGQLFERFRANAAGKDMRLGLWLDSLAVLRAHPFGIGREAFDTVYPVYRTLEIGRPVRFSFVENEPLQMLIDFGYFGFVLLASAVVFPIREIIRHGRRDGVEIALLAGLVAVGAHSVTDFGLETLGVLLPFTAVLGTVLGRNHRSPTPSAAVASQKASRDPFRFHGLGPAIAGLGAGLVAIWVAAAAGGRDFDSELKGATVARDRRAVIADARRAHPVDYYYPLLLSAMEPLVLPGGGHSPRLRALNQALRLCMNCAEVHLQVARTMWRLGRRTQALAEWSTAARGKTAIFRQSLDELASLGAKPTELIRLADQDPQRLLEIARFLLGIARPDQVEQIVAAASRAGAPALEVALLQARMNLAGTDLRATELAIARVTNLAPTDSRVGLLEAEFVLQQAAKDAPSRALALIERALEREPSDLDLQRKRIEIVSRFERWTLADESIVGFKQALQETGRSTVEANLAAAGIYLRLGRIRDAMAEYRIATISDPANVSIWREFASSAEGTRHYVLAREAYTEVMRLNPDKQVLEAIRRIDDAQAAERLGPKAQGPPFHVSKSFTTAP
jgi:tetratricopeptide (TPR) repeat protein